MNRIIFLKKNTKLVLLILCVIIIIIITTMKNTSYNKQKIEIHIGYQSVTAQTWSALIIKNKKLLENRLKEKYPDKEINIIWHDEISGAVINTSMISNKIDIGFMGDMPLLLNMYKASKSDNYDSLLISFDGKGINGLNQSLVIPKNSNIKSLYDLKGKSISTPIGSSAHYMLMKLLEKYELYNDVEIVHQDVAMASQLLSNNMIDAFSIWEPYPSSLIDKGIAKEIVSGEESEIDYIAGVIVNKKLYEENEELLNILVSSLDEAHKFIKNNPKEAAKIFAEESDFDYNTSLNILKNITWDTKIREKDLNTLHSKMDFLINLEEIEAFDLENYIK